MSAFDIFMISGPVQKMIVLVCALFGALICIGAILACLLQWKTSRPGKLSMFDWIMSLAAISLMLLGAFGALYTEFMLFLVQQSIGPVDPAITAPTRAEQLFVLSSGMWPAAFALIVLQIRRRPQTA